MTADLGKCMQLLPNGPGRWHWCDRAADPHSAAKTPRCTGHLTPDTSRKEKTP